MQSFDYRINLVFKNQYYNFIKAGDLLSIIVSFLLRAKLFRAKTWEELRVIAKNNDRMKSFVNTASKLSGDTGVKEACQARSMYQLDINTYEHRLQKKDKIIEEQNEQIQEQNEQIQEQNEQIQEQKEQIEELQRRLSIYEK